MPSRLTTRLRRLEARCPAVADPPEDGTRRCYACCETMGI